MNYRMESFATSLKRLFAIICVFNVVVLIAFLKYLYTWGHTSLASIKAQKNSLMFYPRTTPEDKPNLTKGLVARNAEILKAPVSAKIDPGNQNGISMATGACAMPVDILNTSLIADSKECEIPNLDPYNPDIIKFLSPVTSIKLSGRLFTEYRNNALRILDDVNEGSWNDLLID